ncbi:CHAP domain-containing protein [Microvirga sp. W0021]|uniref:CHAP domain-containing protein n=1 Tax=Hohaiivirga grylli TaxID=3133970 RepID=A0ABV0BF82_9HYPH
MAKPRTLVKVLCIGLLLSGAVVAGAKIYFHSIHKTYENGIIIAQLDDVPVYDNGPIFNIAHGRHYAEDGYYLGQKWQCVEFIKRYLYQAKGHRMPDVWGHAISYYDKELPHGKLNDKRGMIQFQQGGNEKPQQGDLIVFSGAGGYGHVAIIAAVSDNEVEIVQQNSPPAREKLPLISKDGNWEIGKRSTLGWLRIPQPPESTEIRE